MLSCICILFYALFCFQKNNNNNKKLKNQKNTKNNVCLCTLVLVYLGWPLKQSFLNFVCSLDEHLYAQLSK